MEWLDRLAHDFQRSSTWLELALLVGAVAVAYALSRVAGRGQPPDSVWFGRRTLDGLLFPMLALALVYACRLAVAHYQPVFLLRVAVPVLTSLVLIRFVARVLAMAFPRSALMRLLERIVSWLAWGVAVLWIAGLLPRVLQELDEITLSFGKSTISLLMLLQGGLSAALSVLGGALGVGLGFGLQKLASNYVSGFVILLERSLRIGDNVRVDGFEGRITDIKTRYTLIRAGNGRQSIVPNESLITQRVENLTDSDRKFNLTTNLTVAHSSDAARVQRILCDAAAAQPRVLAEPAPVAYLVDFVPDGLAFTLNYWIADPGAGTANVRSAVNLAALEGLRAAGIDIAPPQRVVRVAQAASEGSAGLDPGAPDWHNP
jgi:small-conductance mechanosensitive channel